MNTFINRLRMFLVMLLAVSPIVLAAPSVCILGSYDDRQTAESAGLAGGFVASVDDVSPGANVILLGEIYAFPDHGAIYDMQQRGCKIIRLAGADQTRLKASLKAYKDFVQAGNNPFADIPRTIGTINQPVLFPLLEAVELKKPDKQNLNPDYVPQALLNSPTPAEPDYVPPALAKLASEGRVALQIEFAPQSPVIPNSAFAVLNQVVMMLRANADMKITIEGHTDNYLDSAFNLNLSRQRANGVKNWIVESGIQADRIKTVGYGETRPVGNNDTSAGRRANRRVEIVKD